MMETLAQRSFSMEDQRFFALASGDANPIHLDRTRARRLLAGDVVVHGMHLLLWALDRYAAAGGSCPSAIAASFRAPVLVDRSVVLKRESDGQGEDMLTVLDGDNPVAVVRLSPGGTFVTADAQEGRPSPAVPDDPSPDELSALAGEWPISVQRDDLERAFPCISKLVGDLPVAGLMGLSAVVGMRCPGLHSLFTQVNVALCSGESSGALRWRVARPPRPPAPIAIDVGGAGLRGSVSAFLRPAPIQQPSMIEVQAVVAANSHAAQRALIVGGSRGLGELMAKTIAAGGGHVMLTYCRGAEDAQRVVSEIRSGGGEAAAMALDVAHPEQAVPRLNELGISHCYYFAGPRIGRQKSGCFDPALFAEFADIFVTSFLKIVNSLQSPLAIFYPSTIFVEELPREHMEYVAAKAAGEAACAHLARNRPQMSVVVERLPRLRTDQNAALIGRPCVEALPILAEIARRMSSLSREARAK